MVRKTTARTQKDEGKNAIANMPDKSKLTKIEKYDPNQKVNRAPKVQINGKWVEKPGKGAKAGVTSAARSGQNKETDKLVKSGKIVPIEEYDPNQKVNRAPKVQINGKWVEKPGKGVSASATSAAKSGKKMVAAARAAEAYKTKKSKKK